MRAVDSIAAGQRIIDARPPSSAAAMEAMVDLLHWSEARGENPASEVADALINWRNERRAVAS